MKRIILFLFMALSVYQVSAQCTTAPDGQFPLTNIYPTCVGEPMPIDPFCKTSNYSVVTLASLESYFFSSSVSTDYITITNAAGTIVLSHGVSPVNYVSNSDQDVRFYTHTNAACGQEPGVSRTRYVQCGTIPTTAPDCAFILSPTDGATNVPIGPAPVLSWFPFSSNAYGYKVFLGTSLATATMIANVTQLETPLHDLQPSTQYFVYVVPYNNIGDASSCDMLFASSFTTAAVPSLNCASAVDITACGISQTATFAAASGIFNPVNNTCGFSTPGEEKLYRFTAPTSGNYHINVTATGGGFVDYFLKNATAADCSNYGWSCIAAVGVTGTIPIGYLEAGTSYFLLLDKENTVAGSQTFNIVCPTASPANNEATGAIAVTVNAGCTGAPFTNANAFQSPTEPVPDCAPGGFATVWYSFVAPASGAVRVSTDLGSGNTNFDTRLALYQVGNPADYNSFNLIVCDEDGGSVIGSGNMSVLYATGLTAGNTYYIQVGNKTNTGEGTFCLAVDELNSSMLATTNTCASSYQIPYGNNINYTGWVPLLDASSRLVALVRNSAGGAVENYSFAQHINIGAVRFSADYGTHYLDRNFRISNPSVSNADIQLFYLNAELSALQSEVPAVTVASLQAIKQTETVSGCHPNLNAANGALSEIDQTSSGTANTVSWLQFSTTGFSNFYLKNDDAIVPITILAFQASKQTDRRNYMYWKLNCVGSEDNTIVLERSTDQQNFTAIYTLPGLNSFECNQPFSFIDNNPDNAVNFYRLRIVDADGRVKYSQILSVNNTKQLLSLIQILPNPVKHQANLSFVSEMAKTVEVQIHNTMGAQLSSRKYTVAQGENQIPLNSASLSAGMYYVTIVDGVGVKQTVKFIKQ